MNYIRVTRAGLLFVIVTVALGVVALVSGNNILYLLESFMLTSFAITGFMSERLLRSIDVDIFRSQANANEQSPDLVRVRNLSKRTLHLIQVYEYFEKEKRLLATIETLPPLQETTVRSQAKFSVRGIANWSGFAYGSYYPFGFAFKCFSRRLSGSRIIWPARTSIKQSEREIMLMQSKHRSGTQYTEAEVRKMHEGDTLRSVVWTLSDRVEDEWVVRPTRASVESRHLRLDRRDLSEDELEKKISETASILYESIGDSADTSLTIIDANGEKKYLGSRSSLDALAVLDSSEGAAQ